MGTRALDTADPIEYPSGAVTDPMFKYGIPLAVKPLTAPETLDPGVTPEATTQKSAAKVPSKSFEFDKIASIRSGINYPMITLIVSELSYGRIAYPTQPRASPCVSTTSKFASLPRRMKLRELGLPVVALAQIP